MTRKLRVLLTSLAMVLGWSALATAAEAPASHHVYTITNDAKANAVAVYRQAEDGTLSEVSGSPFATDGKGLTGGDIDEQG
jgi:hypothetical protein